MAGGAAERITGTARAFGASLMEESLPPSTRFIKS
jgi:hypothetical protein